MKTCICKALCFKSALHVQCLLIVKHLQCKALLKQSVLHMHHFNQLNEEFLEDKGCSFDLTLEVRSFRVAKTTPLRN